MNVAHEMVVDAPVERVYGIMSDPEQQARLLEELPFVRHARIRATGSDQGEVEIEIPGQTLRARYSLDADSPRRIRYTATGDWEEVGQSDFETLGDGRTLLRYRAEYELAGATGLLLSGLGLDQRMAQRHLERVKAEAEAS